MKTAYLWACLLVLVERTNAFLLSLDTKTTLTLRNGETSVPASNGTVIDIRNGQAVQVEASVRTGLFRARVASVTLAVDGAVVSTDRTTRLVWEWPSPTVGTHTLTVTVRRRQGARSHAHSVVCTVIHTTATTMAPVAPSGATPVQLAPTAPPVAPVAPVSVPLGRPTSCNESDSSSSVSIVEKAVAFTCATPETKLVTDKVPVVVHTNSDATTKIYFGYTQVTSVNKNPIIALFRNGQAVWCRDDYETTGADAVSLGGLWGGGTPTQDDPTVYAVFTTDGTQGTRDTDFRRYTSTGWLNSYGPGGGPKVSVLVQLDVSDGSGLRGTFVRAKLANGNANTLVITNLRRTGPDCRVVVHATSYFMPLRMDGTTALDVADCAPVTASPFPYTVTLTANLTRATAAVCRIEP